MAIDTSTHPKGPSLDFLLGKLDLNKNPCSAFSHNAAISDKVQCHCGRGAHEHGWERLTTEQWSQLYADRLGKLQAAQPTKNGVDNDYAHEDEDEVPVTSPKSTKEDRKPRRSRLNDRRNNDRRDDRERKPPTVKPTKMPLIPFGTETEDAEDDNGKLGGDGTDSNDDSEIEEKPTVPDYPEWDEVAESFSAMKLKSKLIKALAEEGITDPTVLQQRVIVPLSGGKNLLVQTGPGASKLDAIAISALQFAKADSPATSQVLILAGGQDSANQIYDKVRAIGEPLGLTAARCIGGTPTSDLLKKLESGVHIVVSTTGRLYDVFKKGRIPSDEVKMVMIDQADSQLSAAFQRGHIFEMLGTLDVGISVSLFFSQIEPSITKLVKKFVPDPVQVVQPAEPPVGLKHSWISVEGNKKLDALLGLDLDSYTEQIVIFANARGCQLVHDALEAAGLQVSALYGRMDGGERESTRKCFAEGITRILIATDASLDSLPCAPGVVIVYDSAHNVPRYIARAAICAPGGRVISLVSPRYRKALRKIEKVFLAAEADAQLIQV